MKTVLLTIVIFAGAIAAFQLWHAEPGLVSISYQGWTVETTSTKLLIATIGLIVSTLVLFKLLSVLLRLPALIRNRGQSGKRGRAQKRLLKGFVAFTEGHWQQAAKQLAQPDKQIDTSVINCLIAARACHATGLASGSGNDPANNLANGDYERRDHYLELAAEISPQAHTAIDIIRAEMQIEQQDYAAALETLVFLRSSVPRNARVIALLVSVYQAQQHWSKLDALLPLARRHKAFDGCTLASIEQTCWHGMIDTGEAGQLPGYWQRLRKQPQHLPALLAPLINRLIAEGNHPLAEKILREQLSHNWREEWVALYARVCLEDAAKQLDNAERWLGGHGRSAALLLVLGQLCLRCQLWGKARVYLESSLGIHVSPQTSLALAELLTQLGETDSARDYYASGLRLALNPQADSTQETLEPQTGGNVKSVGAALKVNALPTQTADDETPPVTTQVGQLKLVGN